MRLYVVRHGETEMGKNEIIATKDEPLNENGRLQATTLKDKINKLKIDYIYCSPLGRTRETLKLFEIENIPIIIDNRLIERDMGIYEKAKFNDLDWNTFWGYNSDRKYKELESMKEVYNRVSLFINELKEKYSNEHLLLVTHGGVIRAINWCVNGFDNDLFKCENCKIYEFNI